MNSVLANPFQQVTSPINKNSSQSSFDFSVPQNKILKEKAPNSVELMNSPASQTRPVTSYQN